MTVSSPGRRKAHNGTPLRFHDNVSFEPQEENPIFLFFFLEVVSSTHLHLPSKSFQFF